MRRVFCMILALVLCVSLAVSASAAFTPSAGNTGYPSVVGPTEDSGNTGSTGTTTKPKDENKDKEEKEPVKDSTGNVNAPLDEENKPITDSKGNVAIAVMVAKKTNEDGSVEQDAEGAEDTYVFEDCLLITSVAQAKETGSRLEKEAEEAHKELLEVYEKLESGEMEIPFEDFGLKSDKMVIRDLFDGSLLCKGKITAADEHHPEAVDHDAQLGSSKEEDGKLLNIRLDLGVDPKEEVHVFTYKHHAGDAEGEKSWGEIVDVVNNGDGTVTCTFEHLCPIAICVEGK